MSNKKLITYKNDFNDWILAKYSPRDYTYGSKIYVDENQSVLICDETNKIIKILSNGNYVLDDVLIDSITSYKKTDNPLPFSIYFINNLNSTFSGLWGSKETIDINDIKHKEVLLHLRTRGQFSFKINDYQTFLNSLLNRFLSQGTILRQSLTIYANREINMSLKDIITKYLTDNNIAYQDIKNHINDIAELLKTHYIEHFNKVGLGLINYTVLEIRALKEDINQLNKLENENVVIIDDNPNVNECKHCGAILNENNPNCLYCYNSNPYYIPNNNYNANQGPTPVKKQREEMNMAIFIILIIFFWPGAIIYWLYCKGDI